MTIKIISTLAALTLLVVSTSLSAQQPPAGYQAPTYQAPPSYPSQAPAYQPPAQPAYQPPAYQQPAAPAQPTYQQPAQPAYQQPAYQQPQPAYQQQPSYQPQRAQPAQPGYAQPGYTQPQGYAQPAQPGYAQPAQGYTQPQGYAQPPPSYAPQGYAQPGQGYPTPQNYPQAFAPAAAAGGVAVAGVAATQPSGAAAAPVSMAAGSGQGELYPTHEDTRFGHDHVYPNRGVVVREAPKDATVINYAGLSYRYHEGVWYEPRGPAYMVVEPPIGLVVPALPAFATPVQSQGAVFYYADNTFYRQRPDLAGYEVVNDPSEAMPLTPSATGIPAATPSGAPLVTAAATMGAAPAMAAAASSPPRGTFVVFPKNGQTPEEQARDHYACYQFAVSQTGYDPSRPPAGIPPAQSYAQQSTFQRAQAACYEGRGYSVR